MSSDLRRGDLRADDPTILTVAHWSRLLDGDLYAVSSRIDWAVLLQRVEALRCPKCKSRMRVMATLTEAAAVKQILTHLGLPLPRARARDPTEQQSFDFDAA